MRLVMLGKQKGGNLVLLKIAQFLQFGLERALEVKLFFQPYWWIVVIFVDVVLLVTESSGMESPSSTSE